MVQREQLSDFKDFGGSKWCVSVDVYNGTLDLHVKSRGASVRTTRKDAKVSLISLMTMKNPMAANEPIYGGKVHNLVLKVELSAKWVPL
uniref:Uncharacterized protein n=1 Tax=Ditylenchus dipsaci TaxID=166011 RepID=A0A915D9J2_9BILA